MNESFTLGTHNLHDEAGVPTFFADVIIFTEAVAPTIVAKARQKLAHAQGRLRGYRIAVCHQQPDLVIAYRRRLFKAAGPISYNQYVDGVPGVTPNRGTGMQILELRHVYQLVPVVFEHRINAWHSSQPDRGERVFRRRMWMKHTSGTLDILERLRDSIGLALAGGDVNTPDGIAGYSLDGVLERGDHLDRLALARDRKHRRAELGPATYLSRKGSDHPRVRVTVRLSLEVAPA